MRNLSSLLFFAASDEPSDATGRARSIPKHLSVPSSHPPQYTTPHGTGDTSIVPVPHPSSHSGDTSIVPRPLSPPNAEESQEKQGEKEEAASILAEDTPPTQHKSSSASRRLFLFRDKQDDGKRYTGEFSMNDVSSWLDREQATKGTPPISEQRSEHEEKEEAVPLNILSHPDRLIGQQLGNFRILSCIGRGGFATVYKAEQLYLQQPFAIKVLHIDPKEQPDILERFRREAQALAQLRHNNVVQISDFGLLPELGFYLVMEYLEGQDLRKCFQKEAPFSISRISRIIEQLCSVLDYIHRKGIIHRDLKPANVFLMEDQVFGEQAKLIDFGVASLMREVGLLTQQGGYLGTARYVSPEQAEGAKDVDGRSDLYALGIILHWMLCGKHPFDGENPIGILYQQIHKAPPSLAEQAPQKNWSAQLEEALQTFLAKDRTLRPEHAAAFWQLCKTALEAQKLHDEALLQGDADSFLDTQAVPVSRMSSNEGLRTLRSLLPLPDPLAKSASSTRSPESPKKLDATLDSSLESTLSSHTGSFSSHSGRLGSGTLQGLSASDDSLDSTFSSPSEGASHPFELRERDRTTRRNSQALEETLSSQKEPEDEDEGDSTFLEPILSFGSTTSPSVRVARQKDASDAPHENAGETRVGRFPEMDSKKDDLSVDAGVLDALGFGEATLVQSSQKPLPSPYESKPHRLSQFFRDPRVWLSLGIALILLGGVVFFFQSNGKPLGTHEKALLPPVPKAQATSLFGCPAAMLPLSFDLQAKNRVCLEPNFLQIHPDIPTPYVFAERICAKRGRRLCTFQDWKVACSQAKNARQGLCKKLETPHSKETISPMLLALCAFSRLSLPQGDEVLSSPKGPWVGGVSQRGVCVGSPLSTQKRKLFFRCCSVLRP